jgi:hypothetical protein
VGNEWQSGTEWLGMFILFTKVSFGKRKYNLIILDSVQEYGNGKCDFVRAVPFEIEVHKTYNILAK